MQQDVLIPSFVGWLAVVALVAFRKRLGVLNAASWLVIWGSLVLASEHPQFTLTYAAGVVWPEGGRMVLIPHARIHFFMSGLYAIAGLVLLCVIARTLLRDGRRAGWFALLFALVFGGGIDMIMGRLWYQHGSPLYGIASPTGFGWEFFYVYLGSWIAALAISHRSIFPRTP